MLHPLGKIDSYCLLHRCTLQGRLIPKERREVYISIAGKYNINSEFLSITSKEIKWSLTELNAASRRCTPAAAAYVLSKDQRKCEHGAYARYLPAIYA